MTPGERWAAAVAALPPGSSVVRGPADGRPLDDTGSLVQVGDGPDLTDLLAAVREDLDALVLDAGSPQDGERVLPTALGGAAAWARAGATALAAGRGLDDAYAVVVMLAEAPPDAHRWLVRAAGALSTSLRRHDVVCRTSTAFLVLAPRCEAAGLGERLGDALLGVGVGAAVGAVTSADPVAAYPQALLAAEAARDSRQVWEL